jgi:hypothetical protein
MRPEIVRPFVLRTLCMTALFLRIFVALISLAFGSAWAQTTASASPAMPSTHTLSQQFARVGAFGCAARAHQIASFLSPQNRDIALMQVPVSNPDRSLLSATLVVPMQGTQMALASMALAPHQANGCGGLYQIVVYKPKGCVAALAEDYPAVKAQPLGETAILMGGIDRNSRVLAMPADKGCILMKQETVE